MEFNAEEIRLLIIEKIAGTIEPADDLLLQNILENDSRARELWNDISQDVEQAQAAGFSIEVDEQSQWNQLYPQLEERSNSKILTIAKRFVVAASLLSIIVLTYMGLRSEEKNLPLPVASSLATFNVKVPTLELPNHQLIELKTNQSQNIDGVEFTIKHNSLTYKADQHYNKNWTLMIPPGYDYKVQLSDGTEVTLNAATSITFPATFKGGKREVSVDGEAFFKVAKNKEHPFIAHTDATDVVVTGTEFNVNSYNANSVQTSLVEGSVILKNKDSRQVYLKPGLEASYTDQKGFETHAFDSAEVLSWMKGVYYFRNTPLNELSSVIKRWYNVDSDFASSGLHLKTFSGELRKSQPLQSFLDNLVVSGDVRCQLKNGKIIFR